MLESHEYDDARQRKIASLSLDFLQEFWYCSSMGAKLIQVKLRLAFNFTGSGN